MPLGIFMKGDIGKWILFCFCFVFYIKTFEKVFTLKFSQCLQAPKKYG